MRSIYGARYFLRIKALHGNAREPALAHPLTPTSTLRTRRRAAKVLNMARFIAQARRRAVQTAAQATSETGCVGYAGRTGLRVLRIRVVATREALRLPRAPVTPRSMSPFARQPRAPLNVLLYTVP